MDDDEGPWGVYEFICINCGHKVIVVATVASVEGGYAEAMTRTICTVCEFNLRPGAMN